MPRPSPDQTQDAPYARILQNCLTGELRLVNVGLPRTRKTLSHLLREDYPQVICNDGSTHFFKRNELEYLASILDNDEQEALLLPILIEIGVSQGEAVILALSGLEGKLEMKVASKVLDMPVTCDQGKIRIYKSQLALLRRKLKTATVYVFSSAAPI